MDSHSFLYYTLAVAAFMWAVLGLRFGASVLVANGVLALLFSLLPQAAADNTFGQVLLLCYPLYWGAGFLALRFLDLLPVPAMPGFMRVLLGLCAALFFAAAANWPLLVREGRFIYAVYLADTAERPARIREVLERSGTDNVCRSSHATLMRLAVNAQDVPVVGQLLEAFSRCPSASRTALETVKPLFDRDDRQGVAFLIQCGLKPSSLVFGPEYAHGTALAYAACEDRAELVRMLAASNLEDARSLRYLGELVKTLEEKGDRAMIGVLRDAGVLTAQEPSAPESLK